jgi:hypothetical protein
MPIEYAELKKAEIGSDESFRIAREKAHMLRGFLDNETIHGQICEKDVPGALSKVIQDIISPRATELGFESEARGKFKNYECRNLRPDYFHSHAGIMIEVEKGKTLMNNMDLLDMWKCHICEEAKYLFLIIPKARPDKKGTDSTLRATRPMH